mmetsp:Transcript_781/g.1647  ORF Transcript_781/g.1647 Transcript_781/m.1647 type:complete len:223 (-) Transcript_781:13-681(-)
MHAAVMMVVTIARSGGGAARSIRRVRLVERRPVVPRRRIAAMMMMMVVPAIIVGVPPIVEPTLERLHLLPFLRQLLLVLLARQEKIRLDLRQRLLQPILLPGAALLGLPQRHPKLLADVLKRRQIVYGRAEYLLHLLYHAVQRLLRALFHHARTRGGIPSHTSASNTTTGGPHHRGRIVVFALIPRRGHVVPPAGSAPQRIRPLQHAIAPFLHVHLGIPPLP